MKTFSFVDAAGRPTGATFTGSARALALNTPEGCRAVEGLLAMERSDDPELRRRRVVERIEQLERQQLRPLRELQMNPANVEAARRLAEIEAEIAELRSALRE